LIQVQILYENLKHIRAALGDVVRQEFNAVGAHYRQKGVLSPIKFGPAEFGLYGSQFALQDGDKKISTSTRGLQKTRVNTFGFALY
jgi:hypothetical protein